jgi:Holliday junction resolvase RusA-like endonuclease
MIYRICIAGRLPGLNDMIASQGRPWWVGRGVKEKAMKNVMKQLLAENTPKFQVPITLRIKWIEKDARRDRDNVSGGGAKILLDAMKQLGVIINDSRRWVKDIRHDTSELDKNHPRIEIEIEEAP